MPNDNIKSLSPNDLILKLNNRASSFNISKYDDFLYNLCGDWEFQISAIQTYLKFILSDQYGNTTDLLIENYNENSKMQEFAPKDHFIANLPFPNKFSATIDLATGTGKSWVIYGVSRILLAEGIVDQVLVLCPSTTIKRELFNKFSAFNQDSNLTDSLPPNSKIKVPGIIHSDRTIEKGDICIDNVHKTFDHVSSSISDSLTGKGNKTLVVNDEAHHILSPKEVGGSESKKMLEWYKFLKDSKYDFKYILNTTGTPYKGNDYFQDVIYKFSIRQAIEKKYVKDINYLIKDESNDWNQKWQAIVTNHNELKIIYRKAEKHITIIVTNSIRNSNIIASKLKNFLIENEHISLEVSDKKVIAVTSSPQHEQEREILKTVDAPENPVEWIVSVSMLTEGWDVKNIFQIVPHDERAFNSKLLIAQVLGRGLRIPNSYRNTNIQPIVWVYNHESWSDRIDHLVMEVAEISQRRLTSMIITESKYNFKLHSINIDKEIKKSDKVPSKEDTKLPSTLGFSSTQDYINTEFQEIGENILHRKITYVGDQIKRYSLEQATNELYSYFYMFDMYNDTNILARISREKISSLILKELIKIEEDTVSEPNMQKAKASFGVLLRPYVGFSKIEETYKNIQIISTEDMDSSSISKNAFERYGSLFTTSKNFNNTTLENRSLIEELFKNLNITDQLDIYNKNPNMKIKFNLDDPCYKTPLDIAILNYEPERNFVDLMLDKYIQYIDAWIKSRDQGFYQIPYIHRPGTHSIQKTFNPDFILKQNNKIIIVEIKSEDDSSVKNKDKLEGANSYFLKLNSMLHNEIEYEFHFLDPRDYTIFFEKVLKQKSSFKSKLHATLESNTREDLKGDV